MSPSINMSKWMALIEQFAPLVIAGAAPELLPVAGVIIHGIQIAEGMKDASGAEKLAAATELAITTGQGINAVAAARGQGPTVDIDLLAQSAHGIISATVDTAKLIQSLPGKMATLPPAPIPPAPQSIIWDNAPAQAAPGQTGAPVAASGQVGTSLSGPSTASAAGTGDTSKDSTRGSN